MVGRLRNWRRGIFLGLALPIAMPSLADLPLHDSIRRQLRDQNYVLVEDQDGTYLFVFSSGNVTEIETLAPQLGSDKDPGTDLGLADLNAALEMTRSPDYRSRVRGLTLLSGVDDPAALDAALVLLADPVEAVREEAIVLVVEHPNADIDSVMNMVSNDPSIRVRQAAADSTENGFENRGD